MRPYSNYNQWYSTVNGGYNNLRFPPLKVTNNTSGLRFEIRDISGELFLKVIQNDIIGKTVLNKDTDVERTIVLIPMSLAY